jgi:hypothetical protein
LLRYSNMLVNQASTLFFMGIYRIGAYFSMPRVTNESYKG